MAASAAPAQDRDTPDTHLRPHAGTHVTVYAAEELASDAARLAQRADAVCDALLKLLSPERPVAGAPIAIYLCGSASDPGPASRAAATCAPDDGAIVVHAADEADIAPPAVEITRCVLERLYDGHAPTASPFVEGLAGLAAARARVGPTVADADRAARKLAQSGGSPITALRIPAGAAGDPMDEAARQAAATSFIGFLFTQSGPEALRHYLAAYDPDRQDQAACEAYHQPLAVLEEEWLGRVRRTSNEREALRTFLKQVLPLLRPYRWKQAEILLYLLLAAAYNVVQPYAIKVVIDRLTAFVRHGAPADAGAAFVRTLVPFVIGLLAIYVINGAVSLRRAYAVNWLNQNLLNTLQVRMYAHLQRLSHNFYVRAKVGDIMARLNDDLDTVQSALSQVTNKALYQAFTLIGAIAALCILTRKSPELSIPILFIMPVFAMNYAALRSRNKQASREQRRRVGQAMATIQQNLQAHAVIKAFALEDRTIGEYRGRVLALQRAKLRLALLSAMTDVSEDMTTAVAQLIIFSVGGYLVLCSGGRELGVGDLSALLVLVKSIFSPIASLSGMGQTMQQATGAMERVAELFDEPIAVADRPGATPMPSLRREIRLDHVTFAYGGDYAALRDISITIPACKHVALVGLSGAGKSSIVNLLLRFWDPEEGRVLFDGRDARDIQLASLRRQIGAVFQETFIFDTTLRENIALGRPGATDAEIVEAARAAQLHDFVERLPAGYDTIPGENGARLSVGQKQRIAIARAFLRNPGILVLDEATSALDAQTEAAVLETLWDLARGRTTVSVTHRIAQAASADLIYVMEGGRVVEQGTHADLVRAGGLYQRLFEEATGLSAAAAAAA